MIRHALRTASVFAVGLAASLAAVTAAPQARAPLGINTGRITINGTSNIHEYTASTTTVRVTRAQMATSVPGPAFWDAILKPGALEAFEIAIPATTLHSPKDGLDKNMYKALKTDEHADITFRLVRVEPRAGAGALRAIGVLKIAGVEREVPLDITTERKDATLTVRGEVQLLMTDFGIAPPKAMLGMLKTDPKVKVTFETVLAVPLT